MKNIKNVALILAIMSLFILVLSSCQEDNKGNMGGKNNKVSESEDNQEDIADDTQGEPNKGIENEDKASDNTSSEPDFEDTEFDDQSKDGPREGINYVTLDKPAVDFELEDLNGESFKLSDYRGQIVFLNFWATWCPPCRLEMPYMDNIHKKYEGKDVAVFAVSSTSFELRGGIDKEKAEERVRNFIDKEGLNFPILLDRDNEVVEAYNDLYYIQGIPITYIIDREGNIKYVTGMFESEEQMEAYIDLID